MPVRQRVVLTGEIEGDIVALEPTVLRLNPNCWVETIKSNAIRPAAATTPAENSGRTAPAADTCHLLAEPPL